MLHIYIATYACTIHTFSGSFFLFHESLKALSDVPIRKAEIQINMLNKERIFF